MSQCQELDAAIIGAISGGRRTFAALYTGDVAELAKAFSPSLSAGRLIDRRLQALRKRKLIAFRHHQWNVPQADQRLTASTRRISAHRSTSKRGETATPDTEGAAWALVMMVDRLSNVIRAVDGNNTLGAGALAEAIIASWNEWVPRAPVTPLEDDEDGQPLGYARWYNAHFHGQAVDTSRDHACEASWRAALQHATK